jgi:acetyl esterase/lipase
MKSVEARRIAVATATVYAAVLLAVGSSAGSDEIVEAGIAYREAAPDDGYARERCRLDLIAPADGCELPAIVWFHGGGMTQGAREIPAALRNQGAILVGPSYRLSPRVKVAAILEDAATAVAWTIKNVERYGGSPRRVYVSGHSAGGYLALMVGLDQRLLAAHGLEPNQLAGIAAYSPQAITHFAIRAERGIPDTRPVIDEFAPLYHVRKDAPPILLMTGDREREMLGRYEENAYLARMLQVVGHRQTTLRELPGEDHAGMAAAGHPVLLQWLQDQFDRFAR